MSSKAKSLPQPCGAAPLERNSIVNSVLLPEFSVPSYLRQFAIPAPQIELGISPVSIAVPMIVPSLAFNCIFIFGLMASLLFASFFLSSLNKFIT